MEVSQTLAPTCAGRFSSAATSVKPPTVSSVKDLIQKQQEQCGESDVISNGYHIYMDVQFACHKVFLRYESSTLILYKELRSPTCQSQSVRP